MAPKRINVCTPQKAHKGLKAMGVPSSALGEAKAAHQKSERITPIKQQKWGIWIRRSTSAYWRISKGSVASKRINSLLNHKRNSHYDRDCDATKKGCCITMRMPPRWARGTMRSFGTHIKTGRHRPKDSNQRMTLIKAWMRHCRTHAWPSRDLQLTSLLWMISLAAHQRNWLRWKPWYYINTCSAWIFALKLTLGWSW